MYMILKERNTDLSLSFSFKVDGFNYVVFVSSETMKCFGCGGEGHLVRSCPKDCGAQRAAAGGDPPVAAAAAPGGDPPVAAAAAAEGDPPVAAAAGGDPPVGAAAAPGGDPPDVTPAPVTVWGTPVVAARAVISAPVAPVPVVAGALIPEVSSETNIEAIHRRF